MDRFTLEPLRPSDPVEMASAFSRLAWNKPVKQFDNYLTEQTAGKRRVIVAKVEHEFAGYLTILWQSDYAPFAAALTPEIKDLNVLPRFRRLGIATRLLDSAEAIARERSRLVGLGVGLSPAYGAAQRLYVLRGYIPDARGAAWAGRTVSHGDRVVVDDDLVLFLTKELAA